MGSAVYMNGFNPYAPNNGDDIPNDPGKMFIGGLSWQTTPESIREYFSSFGDLAEVMVMKDPATNKWTSLSLDEWRALHKRVKPGRGVLELMAQEVQCA